MPIGGEVRENCGQVPKEKIFHPVSSMCISI